MRTLVSSLNEVAEELIKDKLLYYFVLLTCIVTYVVYSIYQDQVVYQYQFSDYLGRLSICLKALFFSWSFFFYFKMLIKKEERLFYSYYITLKGMLSPASKVVVFISRVMLLNICLANYTYLKQIIPDIHAFRFDELFYQWDLFLHGGVSPWVLTHELFSSPYWTMFFNFAYNLWFLLIWGSFLYFMWYCKNECNRQSYLLSFFMTWFFIGGILAVAMSSAGPCFMHLLYPDKTMYLPLMERLSNQVDTFWLLQIYGGETSQLQEYLWQSYSSRSTDIGAGISAMPSMHVASSVLLALGAYQINKKVGILLWCFAIIIMIASVHLAWHYAVDGYVALVVTVVIWKVAQFVVGKVGVKSKTQEVAMDTV